jgi:hypothetical protein
MPLSKDARRAYDAARQGSRKSRKPDGPRRIIGIDGEGFTDARGRHLYTYMAASDAKGLVSELVAPKGARFGDVAGWLLGLPRYALLVGYSLGYDRAKWLESLPDDVVYAVEHPELRAGERGLRRVESGDYFVNLLATRFSVAEKREGSVSKGIRNGRQRRSPKCDTRVVWDLFRFYQCSFVKALTRWDIGTDKERADIEAMKAKRGSFAGITAKEQAYCRLECQLLAKLTEALLRAHEDEGITLEKLYGPGSTAEVVLARMGADKQKTELPPGMLEAAECAYFGGRFEVSHVGSIKGRLYGYDIASAYPYAMTRLPCMAHGGWCHVRDSALTRVVAGDAPACVSYCITEHSGALGAWGPLPHRLQDGNIVFPLVSGGGWAWNVELREAMKLHPGVMPLSAWVWRQQCACAPPFAAEIQRLYKRRKQVGKNARGIVLKLALNSLYGKSAQRVGGGGKFRSIVRAGLITATTRAMLLRAVGMARDPWNVLELATDSVLSREPLALELGTELGQWEEKRWPQGAFLVRPGMRFALGDDEHTAARGLGVKTLGKNRARIVRAWAREPMAPLRVQQPSMFHGARSSVWRVESADYDPDEVLWEYRRSADYGRWTEPTPRILSYAPGPKRSGILPSPVVPGGIALAPWQLPMTLRSVPYRAAPRDPDDVRELEAEQPEYGRLAIV